MCGSFVYLRHPVILGLGSAQLLSGLSRGFLFRELVQAVIKVLHDSLPLSAVAVCVEQ